jgi:hypothetical protein
MEENTTVKGKKRPSDSDSEEDGSPTKRRRSSTEDAEASEPLRFENIHLSKDDTQKTSPVIGSTAGAAAGLASGALVMLASPAVQQATLAGLKTMNERLNAPLDDDPEAPPSPKEDFSGFLSKSETAFDVTCEPEQKDTLDQSITLPVQASSQNTSQNHSVDDSGPLDSGSFLVPSALEHDQIGLSLCLHLGEAALSFIILSILFIEREKEFKMFITQIEPASNLFANTLHKVQKFFTGSAGKLFRILSLICISCTSLIFQFVGFPAGATASINSVIFMLTILIIYILAFDSRVVLEKWSDQSVKKAPGRRAELFKIC